MIQSPKYLVKFQHFNKISMCILPAKNKKCVTVLFFVVVSKHRICLLLLYLYTYSRGLETAQYVQGFPLHIIIG